MKVYLSNIGKILAKININEHILPIFLINVINILAKTIKYKESFNGNFSNLAENSELSLACLSLCNKPTLISNRITSFCL